MGEVARLLPAGAAKDLAALEMFSSTFFQTFTPSSSSSRVVEDPAHLPMPAGVGGGRSQTRSSSYLREQDQGTRLGGARPGERWADLKY